MSGQREQSDGLEEPDQAEPLDSTLVMARLFGRTGQDQSNGNGRGNGTGNGTGADPGAGTGAAPVSYLTAEATAGRHRTTRTGQDGPGDPRLALVTAEPEQAAAAEPPAVPAEPGQAAEPAQPAEPRLAAEPEQVPDPEQRALPSLPAARDAVAQAADPDEPAIAGQVTAQAGVPEPEEPGNAAEPERPGSAAEPSTSASTEPASSRRLADQPARRPEPGSRADLKQRLERLPYGHPSSPYHVDGERKPPPPRLMHLELAPPARETSARPGPPGLPGVRWSEPSLPDRHASTEHQDERPPASLAGDAANEDQDQDQDQDQVEDQGDHPGTPVPGHAADQVEDPVVPEAGSRQEPIPAPPPVATGPLEAGVSRSAGPPGQPMPAGRGRELGPASAGPRMTADGSWTWGPASLTSDQVRVAEDAYDRFRAAEGRSLFGSYSSSGLTATLRRIEERVEHGWLAPETEQQALLEPDVFRARFADMLRRHPDRRPELLARRVQGAISYTFIFENEHYADGIRLVQEALEVQGFQLQARKNSWSSAVNRAVFTMWRDPLNDLPFEVQFHTTASLEARQLARTSATLIGDPRIPPAAADSLRSDLASTWAALPSPPGNAEIGDYRRQGSGMQVAEAIRRERQRHTGDIAGQDPISGASASLSPDRQPGWQRPDRSTP